MNAIFVAQGYSIRLFYKLTLRLREELGLEKIGLYVIGSGAYLNLLKQYPELESGEIQVLKEWDITGEAHRVGLDQALLDDYERRLGDPNLWGPVILDRRLIYGKSCKYEQNYKPRFGHEEMQRIMQVGLTRIEEMFDRIEPDFVLSFLSATFGGYIFHLLSRERGIPHLELRTSKIQDYSMWVKSLHDRPPHIIRRFEMNDISPESYRRADEYLESSRRARVTYEGYLGYFPPPADNRGQRLWKRIRRFGRPLRRWWWRRYLGLIQATLEYYRTERHRDNYSWSPILAYLYTNVVRPYRHWRTERLLGRHYVREKDIGSERYAYFPLSMEPEIALSLYARPFLNQIEAVRNFAMSLPLGMKLYVKDHPREWGLRKAGYYRKLLEIPNVRLVDPSVDGLTVIQSCELVVTTRGWTGLEAIVQRKPAVLLSPNCTYSILSMARVAPDLYKLPEVVHEAIENHHHNEEELRRYVAAMIDGSMQVGLYGKLLNWGVPLDGLDEFDLFVDHTVSRLEEEKVVKSRDRLGSRLGN